MARRQPESKLVNDIRLNLESIVGGEWFKVHGGPYQRQGISDLIGCVEGVFFALEVKLPGEEDTLTRLQQNFLENILRNGGFAGIVTSIEEALDVVYGGLGIPSISDKR